MAAMNSKTACAPSPKSWPCYNLILSTEITTVTLHMVNCSTFSHAKFGSQRRKLDLETANVRSKNAEKMRSIGKQSCKPLTLKTPLLFARDQSEIRLVVAWPFCFSLLRHAEHPDPCQRRPACEGEGTCQDSNIKKSQGTSKYFKDHKS